MREEVGLDRGELSSCQSRDRQESRPARSCRQLQHNGCSDLGQLLPNQRPAALAQDDDGDHAFRQVLLVANIAICRQQNVEACRFCSPQQVAIRQPVPTTVSSFFRQRGPSGRKPLRGHSAVEQHMHQRAGTGTSRLRAANSSTALICSRVMGNCSIRSSTAMPSWRFSKMSATGVRVSLNTQAPLTCPECSRRPGTGTSQGLPCSELLHPAYGNSPRRSCRGSGHPPQFPDLPKPPIQLVPTGENAGHHLTVSPALLTD